MTGTVGILNVGAGDTKLTFDKDNPAECIRAARIVKDMVRRGYALLVETEENGQKIYRRAYDFIEGTCEYIIADFDPNAGFETELIQGTAQTNDSNGAGTEAAPVEDAASESPAPGAELDHVRRRPRRTRRVHASTVKAVAVARSAGG